MQAAIHDNLLRRAAVAVGLVNPAGGGASGGGDGDGGGGGGAGGGGVVAGGAAAGAAAERFPGAIRAQLVQRAPPKVVLDGDSFHGPYPDCADTRLHGTFGVTPSGRPGWTLTPLTHNLSHAEKVAAHTPYCFNLRQSDALSLDRVVPDVRHPACRQIAYDIHTMPNTSVVFVFYNEPLSPLFRSIHSVLNRTPPSLLHEIIVVDDGSDAEFAKQPLEVRCASVVTTRRIIVPWRLVDGRPLCSLTCI